MNYLGNCNSHDMDTLADESAKHPIDYIEEEELSLDDQLRAAYLEGVADSRVAIDSILEYLHSGRVGKPVRARIAAIRAVIYPEQIQYTEGGATLKDVADKYDVDYGAFYRYYKDFKTKLHKDAQDWRD